MACQKCLEVGPHSPAKNGESYLLMLHKLQEAYVLRGMEQKGHDVVVNM